mmetsp:Transcript_30206/g.66041  ORF Transcript_30206/g.66041 Transcript_30206/m.66041 type:complete len:200 (+) Transcript_30206:1096-1695(+)
MRESSNSARSLLCLSRRRSSLSVQYLLSSSLSSVLASKRETSFANERWAAARSPLRFSPLARRASISMDCRLRLEFDFCSWPRRSLSQAASSALKLSTVAFRTSRASELFLSSNMVSLMPSTTDWNSRCLASRMPCFRSVGSSRASTCDRSRFSISAASKRRAEESSFEGASGSFSEPPSPIALPLCSITNADILHGLP